MGGVLQMTLINIKGKTFDLRNVQLHTQDTKWGKTLTLTVSFGGSNGSIEYSATEKDKEKCSLIVKAYNYIESELAKDIPEVGFTKVVEALDNLGFTETSNTYGENATGGLMSRSLKKTSDTPLNGIYIKIKDENGVTLTKIGADKFKVTSNTVSTVSGTNFRLHVSGSPNRVYPTLEYIIGGDTRHLDKEKKSKTGIRNQCEEVIFGLAERSVIVSLNEVEKVVRANFKESTILRTALLNTN